SECGELRVKKSHCLMTWAGLGSGRRAPPGVRGVAVVIHPTSFRSDDAVRPRPSPTCHRHPACIIAGAAKGRQTKDPIGVDYAAGFSRRGLAWKYAICRRDDMRTRR